MPDPTVDDRLLPAPAFLKALAVERKRAERSGHAFVLMLLDARGAEGGERGADVLDAAVAAILPAVRETDIAGWHGARGVAGVVFTEVGSGQRAHVVETLRRRMTAALESACPRERVSRLRLSFHVFPDAGDAAATGPVEIEALYPDLVQRHASRRLAQAVKRASDVALGVAALVVLSPLFGVITLAIKLSSPGPVLFRQERLGQYGVPFTFLKFRSMRAGTDAEIHQRFVAGFIRGALPANGHDGQPVFKLTTDPRVTRVGHLLRRTSLDELPQLLNVIRGEMSLVGPRPPIPYELPAYGVWHRRRLLEAKPGLTGLWQVSGRSRLPFDDMVRLDLRYARTWSLWLDCRILLRTPGAVLSGHGAY